MGSLCSMLNVLNLAMNGDLKKIIENILNRGEGHLSYGSNKKT